jgi:hypothetical protein
MGLLQDYCAQTQWFEVLARSGMVWRVNGARPPRLVRAGRARVADVPAFAAVAAQWLEPLDRTDRDAPHLGQRELSGAENAELRRHLRRMTLRPLFALAILLPWLVAVGLRAQDEFPLSWMLLAAGCMVAQVNVFRCFWLARKLGRDLRVGRLVIARTPVEQREPGLPGPAPLSPPEEFLPVSGIIWTRCGLPAPWRVSAAP